MTNDERPRPGRSTSICSPDGQYAYLEISGADLEVYAQRIGKGNTDTRLSRFTLFIGIARNFRLKLMNSSGNGVSVVGAQPGIFVGATVAVPGISDRPFFRLRRGDFWEFGGPGHCVSL